MDNKKQVQKQFGRHADSYVKSVGHAKGKDLSLMVQLGIDENKGKMLDIATGGGHVANAFAPLVHEVVALDLTTEILAAAKKFVQGNGHTNVSFVQGDAEQLPFSDEHFDIVTCRIAPHHFSNVTSFVKETERVLKRGGCLLLIDNVSPEIDEYDSFYNKIEKLRDPSHFRAWKKSEWVNMVESASLSVEQLITFDKTFQFSNWCELIQLSKVNKATIEGNIVQASLKVKEHFHILIEDETVVSFQGEGMLLKGRKKA
ncbi:methyltransferase domain-containing protein [Evansella sp. AB-P1]|uniref:class I SAM-dependent methyltransferase n=1 Tax=Evansella sp. AB-P1 TaxID=3037653 RepID=UPI00241FB263|nr:class I SAM-dependent methyltransferase [Evansella sp. AB-P1]MDG5787201.1 methyltransferase domain-containing protein [Evansella sp. AB-P1]